jgi:hypothetical protein
VHKTLIFILPYLKSRLWVLGAGLYLGLGVILFLSLQWNILPPCLWTSLWGIRCPGCGLTTAFLHLIQGQTLAAWDSNPLLFLVLPAGIYLGIWDFIHFLGQSQKVQNQASRE